MVGNEQKRHYLSVLPQIIHVTHAKNGEWHGAIESQSVSDISLFQCEITILSYSISSQREMYSFWQIQICIKGLSCPS